MTVSSNPMTIPPAGVAPTPLPGPVGNPEAAGDDAASTGDFAELMEQTVSGEAGRAALSPAPFAVEGSKAPSDDGVDNVVAEEDDDMPAAEEAADEEDTDAEAPGWWMPASVGADIRNYKLDTNGDGETGADPRTKETPASETPPGVEDGASRAAPAARGEAADGNPTAARDGSSARLSSPGETNAGTGQPTPPASLPATGTPQPRQEVDTKDAGADLPDRTGDQADPEPLARTATGHALRTDVRADGVAMPDAAVAHEPRPADAAGTGGRIRIEYSNTEGEGWDCQAEADGEENGPPVVVPAAPDRAAYFAGRNSGLLRDARGRARADENNSTEVIDRKIITEVTGRVGIEPAKSVAHMPADFATAPAPTSGPVVSGANGGGVSHGVEAASLVEKVIEAAGGLAGTRQGRVTVEVDLEQAGPVSVEVSLRDGRLHAVFRSDSQTMRESLALAWRQHGARPAEAGLSWAEPQIIPSRPSSNENPDTGGFQEQAGFQSGGERQPRPGGPPQAPGKTDRLPHGKNASSPAETPGGRMKPRLLSAIA